jgi:hypothetical protein
MRALSWRRASAGAGLLCYRCIQIAPECSSAGSEQALQTLRDRFPRRIRWVCAYHVLIASRAQFAHRKLTGKNRSWSNTRGSTRCRGVEEGPRPLSSAHTQAVRKTIVASCKRDAVLGSEFDWSSLDRTSATVMHEYASIGDVARLGQQLSAVSIHLTCLL